MASLLWLGAAWRLRAAVLEIASNWTLYDSAERAWLPAPVRRPFRASGHDVTAGDCRMTCKVTS